jgi:hypothetical protein
LKRLCGADLVDEVLGTSGKPSLRFFDPKAHPYVPVEFSLAAYRVGHSMVRPEYALSERLLQQRGDTRLSIFGGVAEDSLVGGRMLPPGWTVQWSFFIEQENSADVQYCKALGPQISRPLRFLPMPPTDPPRLHSLAFRTLLRGWYTGLPSGQEVAQRVAATAIDGNDPLWVYLLKEAAQTAPTGAQSGSHATAGGRRLGPLGARIVAEVFIGLLTADPSSYLVVKPSWTPESGPFGLADFLAEAGAPISKQEWDGRPGA